GRAHRATPTVSHTHLEHSTKNNGNPFADMDATIRNRIHEFICVRAPLRSTAPSSSAGTTRTTLTGSAIPIVRVVRKKTILQLIEFAVLLMHLVEGAIIESFLPLSIDLMREFFDFLSDESVKGLD